MSRPAASRTARSALLLWVMAGCGHSIAPGIADQSSGRVDFRQPCTPAEAPADLAPADAVVVRYLGASGLYIGWSGHAILTSPFFSNQGLLRTLLGRMRPNVQAIKEGLTGVPGPTVGAILVGHAHYDHFGDVPAIADETTSGARIYLNRAGYNALQPFPDLQARSKVIEELQLRPTLLSDAAGHDLPFRITPVLSDHASHVGPITLWRGDIKARSTSWDRRRYGSLRAGQPFSFVIDLLASAHEDAPVRFRIFYQESAVREPVGWPAVSAGEPPYDLAVVCVASAHHVLPYPDGLLRQTRPRHVLATHYENFFRPPGLRQDFVPLLTRTRAEAFLRRVSSALGDAPSAGPVGPVCGPSSPRWTMPRVGEWLTFRPSG